MARKGKENLIPFSDRSLEEARESGRKGGIASGKARREKADLRKMMAIALDEEIKGKDLTHGQRIIQSVLNIAENPKNGAAAIRAFESILKMLGQDLPDAGGETIPDDVRAAIEVLLRDENNVKPGAGD